MRYFIMLVILISFISGCGHRQPQLIRHSYATNYKIEEIKTAYVGQSIVKVKDYYAYKSYVTTFIEPTENFTLTATIPNNFSVYNLNISGLKGKRYETYYKEQLDGILYNIMYFTDSKGNNSYGVLIDNEGKIKNNTLYRNIKPTDFTLQPPNVKFIKSTINTENFLCDPVINYSGNTCGWINYELIYSGINNISLNISYKEYSRDDYARTAFYQDLTFEPTAKQIRFKDFIIEIAEATNDKLVYKILSDGLKEAEFLEGEDPAFNRISSASTK
jgi:hypothetical protein